MYLKYLVNTNINVDLMDINCSRGNHADYDSKMHNFQNPGDTVVGRDCGQHQLNSTVILL